MKIVYERRKTRRRASASEETEQPRNQERVSTTSVVMTTFDNTPDDSDAFSLGSVDSFSSMDNPLRCSVIEGKVLQKEEYYSKRKGKTEMANFMEAREMTVTQERWNAITILPNPIYCLYYIFAGHWVSGKYASIASMDQDFDQIQCLNIAWLPDTLPPFPVACITAAICLHAPASFLYHWVYSHSLTPIARISHWSRRLDHVFIHVASALLAYGTSGSWDYFLVNLMFNGDCVYRQLLKKVRPRRNQVRVAISILAYTIPILRRGDVWIFLKCWFVVSISGWLFVTYPLKGWSHAAFHLVISFLPPLLLQVAVELPVSQEQITLAVQCAAARGQAI